jgi:uncharacterized protein
MDVTPVLATGAPAIEAYGPDGFRVNGQQFVGPVLLTPQGVTTYSVTSFAGLTLADITALLLQPDKPDVILLGVGGRCDALPPKEWRAAAKQAEIVLEAMGSAAACRTWNVLLGEGRRVCALVFPV